jgi:mycoredoxin
MGKDCIIFYGTSWCGDCRRSIRFLEQHEIPYEYVDIDKDKEGEQYVRKVNNGMRSVPTILFQDGSTLVEPSNVALAQKLNLPFSS